MMDSVTREMKTMREQNVSLNRQLNENLQEMRECAKHFSSERASIQEELRLLKEEKKAQQNEMKLASRLHSASM